MSAQSLLEQLLRQGAGMLQGQGTRGLGGAAVPGVLGMLLGRKKVLRQAGPLVKYGGLAALGVMAYKAYTQWQAQQAKQAGQARQGQPAAAGTQPSATPHGAPTGFGTGATAPRTADRLDNPAEQEQHSRAILGAMIAAAKADGHLDARERELLDTELGRLAADHALRQWVEAELQRPLDPAEVARSALGQPALAAEVYLASLLVADAQSFMERAYLDELARQLGLAPALKAQLEAQAAQV